MTLDQIPFATEYDLHRACIAYLRRVQPGALFYSDMRGVKLSPGTARKNAKLQMRRTAWLDIFIADPRRGYSGLAIELKNGPAKLYKKNGELRGDKHIQAQRKTIEAFEERGFCAAFVTSYQSFIDLIDWYFELVCNEGNQ